MLKPHSDCTTAPDYETDDYLNLNFFLALQSSPVPVDMCMSTLKSGPVDKSISWLIQKWLDPKSWVQQRKKKTKKKLWQAELSTGIK